MYLINQNAIKNQNFLVRYTLKVSAVFYIANFFWLQTYEAPSYEAIQPGYLNKEQMQCLQMEQSPFHTGYRYENLECFMIRVAYHEIVVVCDKWKGMFLLVQEIPYNTWLIKQKVSDEEHKAIGKFVFENKKFPDVKSIPFLLQDSNVDATLIMGLVTGFYLMHYNYLTQLQTYVSKNKIEVKSDLVNPLKKTTPKNLPKSKDNRRNSIGEDVELLDWKKDK